MSKSQEICDLLTTLLAADPGVKKLFTGIPANEAIEKVEGILIRSTKEGKYLTVPGIISAIGRILGEPIASVYDENFELIGFVVPDPKTIVYNTDTDFPAP